MIKTETPSETRPQIGAISSTGRYLPLQTPRSEAANLGSIDTTSFSLSSILPSEFSGSTYSGILGSKLSPVYSAPSYSTSHINDTFSAINPLPSLDNDYSLFSNDGLSNFIHNYAVSNSDYSNYQHHHQTHSHFDYLPKSESVVTEPLPIAYPTEVRSSSNQSMLPEYYYTGQENKLPALFDHSDNYDLKHQFLSSQIMPFHQQFSAELPAQMYQSGPALFSIDEATINKSHALNTYNHTEHTATHAPTKDELSYVEAIVHVKTELRPKYWRNGRRNLQCFPRCQSFGDYYLIKLEDLKQHDFMWGKCRGSVEVNVSILNSSVHFDSVVVLGRIQCIDQTNKSYQETFGKKSMVGMHFTEEEMHKMKQEWINGERQSVALENSAQYIFKPKVWKYNNDLTQGKYKRHHPRYYLQFETFILTTRMGKSTYVGIGSGASTQFEVGSSRVLARQKRKAAKTGSTLPVKVKASTSKKAQIKEPTILMPPRTQCCSVDV